MMELRLSSLLQVLFPQSHDDGSCQSTLAVMDTLPELKAQQKACMNTNTLEN